MTPGSSEVATLSTTKEPPKKSAKEQIAALDARLGKGLGALKERARLEKQLEEEQKNAKIEKKHK